MRKFACLALLTVCVTAGSGPVVFAQPSGGNPAGGPGIAPMTPRTFFAKHLGISYVPVTYSNGTFGLRLIAPPAPGSPGAELQLDTGDVVFALDGQRFTIANDVQNHFDMTSVSYVDASTQTRRNGNVMLPPAGGPPAPESLPTVGAPVLAMGGNQIGPPAATEGRGILFAAHLGISYLPIRYGNGTFGLRLAAPPVPGSPASALPLDAGDVIFALDGQRITTRYDVMNHFDQTTVAYVDASTNSQRVGNINLPSAPVVNQGFGGRANLDPQVARSNAGASDPLVTVAPEAPVSAGGGAQLNPTSGVAVLTQPGQADVRPSIAENLGIIYVPVNNGNGTFGLRLVRPPLANSPGAQLGLDTNDVVYMLDGQPFTNPFDVKNHYNQTTVNYIDVSTNTTQSGTITLPAQNP